MSALLRVIIFLILSWVNISPVFSNERLWDDEVDVLVPFFKTIFEKTEAGYVFYDKKPMCAIEFCENSCSFQNELHAVSMAIWGGKKILNRSLFSNGNVLLHLDDKEGWLLIINRKLFLRTVQDNLALFQYVLGPTITPEILLEELLSPNQSFQTVFNNDRTLIGILFGHGAQNALFQSRLETIQYDAFDSPDIPPFSSKATVCFDDLSKEIMLFFSAKRGDGWSKEKMLRPSLRYFSLEQEAEDLLQKLDLPSKRLIEEQPYFIFNSLKDQEENRILIHELEKTQNKIQCLLHSPTFLEDTLHMLTAEQIEIEKGEGKNMFTPPHVNVNVAVAKLLKNDLLGCEGQNSIFFIEGLLVEQGGSRAQSRQQLMGFSESYKNLKTAKQNLENADLFFETLAEDETCISLLDRHLYYKILNEGSGCPQKDETQVCVDFQIFDPNGKCLSIATKKNLDLENTIPGFAHGMRDMKVGETREIYIHPSLAYGVHTFLDKGMYLKAWVHLVALCDSEGTLPSLIPQDLSFIWNENFQKKCEEEYKNSLYELGVSRGEFLKSCQDIDTAQVAKSLQSFRKDNSLSQDELDALNQIFWDRYFGR